MIDSAEDKIDRNGKLDENFYCYEILNHVQTRKTNYSRVFVILRFQMIKSTGIRLDLYNNSNFSSSRVLNKIVVKVKMILD